jgi:desulfoferrodoxin-like iron-binding protein
MTRNTFLKLLGVGAFASLFGAKNPAPYKNRKRMVPANPKKMTPHELKHTPLMTLGQKDEKGYTQVLITVGQGGIIHPSVANHWIDFIELFADGKRVGKVELDAVVSRGATCFSVKLDGVKQLSCDAGCNLHGIYRAQLAL